MVQEIFQQISDFILKYNPYLEKGYPDVVRETSTGLIIKKDTPGHNEHTVIFPNDALGTYFYLRNEGLMNFSLTSENAVSDCMTGANQFQIPIRLVVVAHQKSDPYLLVNNLVNTLIQFKFQTSLTSAEWNAEKILPVEMSGARQADIDAALQRVGHSTIMAISFLAILPIEFLGINCLPNPCLPC